MVAYTSAGFSVALAAGQWHPIDFLPLPPGMSDEVVTAELCDDAPGVEIAEVDRVSAPRPRVRWRRQSAAWGVSLAVHALAAGALGSFATVEIIRFGGFQRLGSAPAMQVEWAEVGDGAGDFTITADPAPTIITPSEAWHDQRHFVAQHASGARVTTNGPPLEHLLTEAGGAAATEDSPAFERKELREPSEPIAVAVQPSRKGGGPRRRAAARGEPSVVSIDAPHPDFRFSGSPCRYPDVAISSGWQGTVMLRIRFADDGFVVDVDVEKSSGYSVLDAEAIRAARGWRVVPANRGGRVRGMTVIKPIEFVLDGR